MWVRASVSPLIQSISNYLAVESDFRSLNRRFWGLFFTFLLPGGFNLHGRVWLFLLCPVLCGPCESAKAKWMAGICCCCGVKPGALPSSLCAPVPPSKPPKPTMISPLVLGSQSPLFTAKPCSPAKSCCCAICLFMNFLVDWMFVGSQ